MNTDQIPTRPNDIAMHQFNDRLSQMTSANLPYGVTRLHPNLAIASRPGPGMAGPHSTEIKVLWLDGTAIRMIDHIALHSEGAPLVASVVNELLLSVFASATEPKVLLHPSPPHELPLGAHGALTVRNPT